MNILQVSMLGNIGGAAKYAWNLSKAFRLHGHRSMLAIGYINGFKVSDDIFELNNDNFRNKWCRLIYWIPNYMRRNRLRGAHKVRNVLMMLAQPHRYYSIFKGKEDYEFPASSRLFDIAPVRPDIVNCHNLHSDYFDLRVLPELSKRVPMVLTLHDMWLLTGHCAHAMNCNLWKSGCGNCPDLNRYPSVIHDATAYNWLRKKSIFSSSQIYLISPCNWLMQKVRESILQPIQYKIIPNGVNLKVFRPINIQKARKMLYLPTDAFIILFAGGFAKAEHYKDYATVKNAVIKMVNNLSSRQIILICLGEKKDKIEIQDNFQIRSYTYKSGIEDVSQFYQASDVFLHATHADTFPTTILESLACGTPVIATSVGGISEQINDGLTGFLVPENDSEKMAQRLLLLFHDTKLRLLLSTNAIQEARSRFDFDRQVTSYLNFYSGIIQYQQQVGN